MKSAARVLTAKRQTSSPQPPVGSGGTGATAGLIGRSGLPWNAGYFGMVDSISAANTFATWLGRPLDAVMYFPARSTWANLKTFKSDYAAWPGYRIISVPPQPDTTLNTPTANGDNNANWVDWANTLKTAWGDDGRTIVRLGWENNGDWYKWGWGNATNYPNASAAASTFVAAYTNVVNSCRSVAPHLLFNCCMNTGSGRSGIDPYTHIWAPLLAAGVIDMVSVDWYDWYPAQNTQGQFDSKASQSPGATNLHAWCVSNDVPMWIDESGLIASAQGGGGDDPNWIDKTWTWLQDHAVGNGGKLLGHTTYNDSGAPNTLHHVLYDTRDGSTENPNAAARYKASNRWGV